MGSCVSTKPNMNEPSEPRIECHMKVYLSSKYDDTATVNEIDPNQSGIAKFCEAFYQNEIDEYSLALRIIEAYFASEFVGDGSRWSHDGSSISKISQDGADPVIFNAKESATWDHKDIYAVAKAAATIQISRSANEVKILNYSYYVSG